MDDDARRQAFHIAVTTEHFVVQGRMTASISEGSSRSSMYLLALSSSLVALGFSVNSEAFPVFAATIIPVIFVLGVFSVMRLTDTSLENYQALHRLAEIHKYYSGLVSDGTGLFPPADAEWARMRPSRARFPLVGTMATTIGVVNAMVGGSGLGVILTGAGLPLWVALAAGGVLAVTLTAVTFVYQSWRFARTTKALGDT